MDTLRYTVSEVVVTGTRTASEIRHLPLMVSVVGSEQINAPTDLQFLMMHQGDT